MVVLSEESSAAMRNDLKTRVGASYFFKPNKEKERTSAYRVIDDALRIIGKSLENNNIRVEYVKKCEKVINTYPNELLQVFLNIIQNAKEAIKNRKQEQENAFISIAVFEEKESINILICDNGGGIPKEIANRVFEPYFTTKVKSGTGLGLYMSKIIIEKHLQGTIRCENTEEGTCFRIALPLDSLS